MSSLFNHKALKELPHAEEQEHVQPHALPDARAKRAADPGRDATIIEGRHHGELPSHEDLWQDVACNKMTKLALVTVT